MMQRIIHNVRSSQKGQGITEYVVMLTLILMLVMGTVRLAGVNAKNALSKAANALQHHSAKRINPSSPNDSDSSSLPSQRRSS
jgi:Flp pilus assembly pilin Flp